MSTSLRISQFRLWLLVVFLLSFALQINTSTADAEKEASRPQQHKQAQKQTTQPSVPSTGKPAPPASKSASASARSVDESTSAYIARQLHNLYAASQLTRDLPSVAFKDKVSNSGLKSIEAQLSGSASTPLASSLAAASSAHADLHDATQALLDSYGYSAADYDAAAAALYQDELQRRATASDDAAQSVFDDRNYDDRMPFDDRPLPTRQPSQTDFEYERAIMQHLTDEYQLERSSHASSMHADDAPLSDAEYAAQLAHEAKLARHVSTRSKDSSTQSDDDFAPSDAYDPDDQDIDSVHRRAAQEDDYAALDREALLAEHEWLQQQQAKLLKQQSRLRHVQRIAARQTASVIEQAQQQKTDTHTKPASKQSVPPVAHYDDTAIATHERTMPGTESELMTLLEQAWHSMSDFGYVGLDSSASLQLEPIDSDLYQRIEDAKRADKHSKEASIWTSKAVWSKADNKAAHVTARVVAPRLDIDEPLDFDSVQLGMMRELKVHLSNPSKTFPLLIELLTPQHQFFTCTHSYDPYASAASIESEHGQALAREALPFFIAPQENQTSTSLLLKPLQKVSLGPLQYAPTLSGTCNGFVLIRINRTRVQSVRLTGRAARGLLTFAEHPDDPVPVDKESETKAIGNRRKRKSVLDDFPDLPQSTRLSELLIDVTSACNSHRLNHTRPQIIDWLLQRRTDSDFDSSSWSYPQRRFILRNNGPVTMWVHDVTLAPKRSLFDSAKLAKLKAEFVPVSLCAADQLVPGGAKTANDTDKSQFLSLNSYLGLQLLNCSLLPLDLAPGDEVEFTALYRAPKRRWPSFATQLQVHSPSGMYHVPLHLLMPDYVQQALTEMHASTYGNETVRPPTVTRHSFARTFIAACAVFLAMGMSGAALYLQCFAPAPAPPHSHAHFRRNSTHQQHQHAPQTLDMAAIAAVWLQALKWMYEFIKRQLAQRRKRASQAMATKSVSASAALESLLNNDRAGHTSIANLSKTAQPKSARKKSRPELTSSTPTDSSRQRKPSKDQANLLDISKRAAAREHDADEEHEQLSSLTENSDVELSASSSSSDLDSDDAEAEFIAAMARANRLSQKPSSVKPSSTAVAKRTQLSAYKANRISKQPVRSDKALRTSSSEASEDSAASEDADPAASHLRDGVLRGEVKMGPTGIPRIVVLSSVANTATAPGATTPGSAASSATTSQRQSGSHQTIEEPLSAVSEPSGQSQSRASFTSQKNDVNPRAIWSKLTAKLSDTAPPATHSSAAKTPSANVSSRLSQSSHSAAPSRGGMHMQSNASWRPNWSLPSASTPNADTAGNKAALTQSAPAAHSTTKSLRPSAHVFKPTAASASAAAAANGLPETSPPVYKILTRSTAAAGLTPASAGWPADHSNSPEPLAAARWDEHDSKQQQRNGASAPPLPHSGMRPPLHSKRTPAAFLHSGLVPSLKQSPLTQPGSGHDLLSPALLLQRNSSLPKPLRDVSPFAITPFSSAIFPPSPLRVDQTTPAQVNSISPSIAPSSSVHLAYDAATHSPDLYMELQRYNSRIHLPGDYANSHDSHASPDQLSASLNDSVMTRQRASAVSASVSEPASRGSQSHRSNHEDDEQRFTPALDALANDSGSGGVGHVLSLLKSAPLFNNSLFSSLAGLTDSNSSSVDEQQRRSSSGRSSLDANSLLHSAAVQHHDHGHGLAARPMRRDVSDSEQHAAASALFSSNRHLRIEHDTHDMWTGSSSANASAGSSRLTSDSSNNASTNSSVNNDGWPTSTSTSGVRPISNSNSVNRLGSSSQSDVIDDFIPSFASIERRSKLQLEEQQRQMQSERQRLDLSSGAPLSDSAAAQLWNAPLPSSSQLRMAANASATHSSMTDLELEMEWRRSQLSAKAMPFVPTHADDDTEPSKLRDSNPN